MKRKKKSNKSTDFVSESKVANKMHDHYLHKSQPFLFVMKMIYFKALDLSFHTCKRSEGGWEEYCII